MSDDEDDDEDDDKLLFENGWPTNESLFPTTPFFQPETLISNRNAPSRIWICIEPESKLCWIKFEIVITTKPRHHCQKQRNIMNHIDEYEILKDNLYIEFVGLKKVPLKKALIKSCKDHKKELSLNNPYNFQRPFIFRPFTFKCLNCHSLCLILTKVATLHF